MRIAIALSTLLAATPALITSVPSGFWIDFSAATVSLALPTGDDPGCVDANKMPCVCIACGGCGEVAPPDYLTATIPNDAFFGALAGNSYVLTRVSPCCYANSTHQIYFCLSGIDSRNLAVVMIHGLFIWNVRQGGGPYDCTALSFTTGTDLSPGPSIAP